jgi:flagellar biogenesis protein FliO
MYALFVLLFIATAAWTVRHVISGVGAAPPDDGSDEGE